MRILCLTCEALARPVYFCAALSPHIVDVVLVVVVDVLVVVVVVGFSM